MRMTVTELVRLFVGDLDLGVRNTSFRADSDKRLFVAEGKLLDKSLNS